MNAGRMRRHRAKTCRVNALAKVTHTGRRGSSQAWRTARRYAAARRGEIPFKAQQQSVLIRKNGVLDEAARRARDERGDMQLIGQEYGKRPNHATHHIAFDARAEQSPRSVASWSGSTTVLGTQALRPVVQLGHRSVHARLRHRLPDGTTG